MNPPRGISTAALAMSMFVLAICAGGPSLVYAAPPFHGTIFIDQDIITPSDPTLFLNAAYTGRGQRLMFDRRSGWIWNDAYLFQAAYEDGLSAEIQVNSEFESVDAAEVEALKYGEVVGRLPTSLRARVETFWIHKGVHPFGGGNDNLLVHTGQAELYEAAGILEETFVHEAAHTSLDPVHADAPQWIAAQNSDPDFISTYAESYPGREDIAESFLPYLALRYRPGRISQELADIIQQTIPNRIDYFDAMEFDAYPIVSPECGNGRVESGEACDDGNAIDDDCCSATCMARPPAATCRSDWGKASVQVAETRFGRERIKVDFKKGPALAASDFGDPANASAAYSLCFHDANDNLAGALTVDRAGEACSGEPCWRNLGTRGFLYKDRLAASHGVTRMRLVAGAAGRSRIQIRATNNSSKGQTTMPTGVASALAGSSRATLQLHLQGGGCFEAVLDDVKRNEPTFFKAGN